MNKAPPIPAPPAGKAPPAKYSIPRRRSSSQPRPVPAVVVTPPQPIKQQGKSTKSTKAPKAATKGTTKGTTKTKQSGETDGDKAMRLQMEAYLKRPKGSDTESSSSRSSGRTTRGSTKRVHSPGEPSKTKKKDEKSSPAPAATTPK